MLLDAFATLAELKSWLGIATNDTTDDALLLSMLRGTAGVIEGMAGRPLIRKHAREEVFVGGRETIRIDVPPIAKLHSVRESETRDFETSGAYEELAEGTDFVFDEIGGGREGESGVIRRLDGKWLGSAKSPGRVRVVYTGGFKTDGESEIENARVTLSDASAISIYTLTMPGTDTYTVSAEYFDDDTPDTSRCILPYYSIPSSRDYSLGVLRFDLTGLILPTWNLVQCDLYWSNIETDEAKQTTIVPVLFATPDLDPAGSDYESLWDEISVGGNGHDVANVSCLSSGGWYQNAMLGIMDTSAIVALFQQAAIQGFLAFGFRIYYYGADYNISMKIAHTSVANPLHRPYVTITHRRSILDPFVVPADLRQANLIQAAHEFQTRRSPGLISTFTRGASVSTGGGMMKPTARLLPEVQDVALRYRHLY
ncbi:MAG TPA: hypothetical protein VMX97_18055 [Hyphomicrobiaceae bacterium]|nr:hypothetical protein [Hyphomicrobiaceae bacterium]